jgi:hypothetical protein
MPKWAKEKEMAKKYGQDVKLSGFTRGGAPVGKRAGSKGPKPKTTRGDGFTPAEVAALGLAGALTAGAGGLIIGGLKRSGKK